MTDCQNKIVFRKTKTMTHMQNKQKKSLVFSNASLGGKTARKTQEVITIKIKVLINFGGKGPEGNF